MENSHATAVTDALTAKHDGELLYFCLSIPLVSDFSEL